MDSTTAPKKTGYQPREWESKLYQLWLNSGFFNPDVALEKGVADPAKIPFSMVLPPPNATGTLHTGSACMLAIEDTFTRFARMEGRPTLWLPGTDHAAIATQSKVERLLWEEEGKTRYDLGREELLGRIDAFVKTNQNTMIHQMEKMGASLDWSRLAFTLDEPRHKSVNQAFKKMYDEGIIYRGERIVNWDPKGQTTISDDEVVYQEETAKLYYFQYGPFVISTARPETKFGDKYVVMHPEDERYKEYEHGQKIGLEWINGPITATIIKDAAIDPEFGTGVMTITPWHSAIDFEIAERHQLDKEQIIALDGTLLPIAEEFSGMDIVTARPKIVEKLQDKGLVVKIEENYLHQIATAERTGALVEPQIMRQWFINVTKEFTRNGRMVTLKTLMQEAVRSGNVNILPERFEKNYFHWVDNLRDWCISRQIWYGHRIPVWYKGEEVYCGVTPPAGEGWDQDPDTLDTWFSSALWTFSTLGWGNDEQSWDKQRHFHPTSILETGYDILPFWVSRMILMSTYFLDEVPFKTVYLHGLVRDEKGRKMSKSLDNILDPLDVIEEFGTDALRLALTGGTTPGNDFRLGDEKLTSSRNFVNKLWNLSRYVDLQALTSEAVELKTSADHFIVARFQATHAAVTAHLSEYSLALAIDALRDFTITDFADWYVEIHKQEKNTALLREIFQELITLWHPFIPFVTEAIQQEVFDAEELLLVRPWPTGSQLPSSIPKEAETFMNGQQLVTDIRNIRSTYNISPATELEISLTEPSAFESLLSLAKVRIAPAIENGIPVGPPGLGASVFVGNAINVETEKARLVKELSETSEHLASLNTKLANQKFMESAPEEIRLNTQKLAVLNQEKIAALTQALRQLN